MIDYQILPDQKLIVLCHWGETSVIEISKLSQKLGNDPDYSQNYDMIVDMTHLIFRFTTEEMKILAAKSTKKISIPVKVALVAPTDLGYGMNRMFEMIVGYDTPVKFRVFRNISLAMEWIDRKSIDIEKILEGIKKEKALHVSQRGG